MFPTYQEIQQNQNLKNTEYLRNSPETRNQTNDSEAPSRLELQFQIG